MSVQESLASVSSLDSLSAEESSVVSSGDSTLDESSLINFMKRFNRADTAQQTVGDASSITTQTMPAKKKANRKRAAANGSHAPAEVVAVIAPPSVRTSKTNMPTSNYAFMEAPPLETRDPYVARVGQMKNMDLTPRRSAATAQSGRGISSTKVKSQHKATSSSNNRPRSAPSAVGGGVRGTGIGRLKAGLSAVKPWY